MIQGGTPTIYVSDLERAVTFYTRTLGLKLLEREDDDWASIDAGDGLVLGLQPTNGKGQQTGEAGGASSMAIGFNVTEPLEEVVAKLEHRGVSFRGPIKGKGDMPVRFAFFGDPDGNALYLCEFDQAD
jgi:catechol 2,3-dioxygenase-like lactoylglutathione lyase family enzyme